MLWVRCATRMCVPSAADTKGGALGVEFQGVNHHQLLSSLWLDPPPPVFFCIPHRRVSPSVVEACTPAHQRRMRTYSGSHVQALAVQGGRCAAWHVAFFVCTLSDVLPWLQVAEGVWDNSREVTAATVVSACISAAARAQHVTGMAFCCHGPLCAQIKGIVGIRCDLLLHWRLTQ